MTINLKGRSYLKIIDFSPEELNYLLDLSHELKAKKRAGEPHRYLEGKNIVLLFEKTSTRTRCAFEVAAHDLGMGVTYLDPKGSQMGHKESIEDTAKVLGRFFDGIEYRGFGQDIVEALAQNSGVPVWNGLTDEAHPTQMIADMMTIQENFGKDIKGLKFVYMGDARNNVANSLAAICAKLGLNFVACGPKHLQPGEWLIKECEETCAETGGSILVTDDVATACKDAHVIYTDIWVSMGEDKDIWEQRIHDLLPYQVNENVMSLAAKDGIFMHCLPSYHDLNTKTAQDINRHFGLTEMEVTDAVFSSARSKVFDEAENRMHSIKAIMLATLQ